jgi:bifunctional non-homologous end joining protein LigD
MAADPMPTQVQPMLLQAARAVPEGPGWAFEVKHDGFRGIAFISGGRVRLQSRQLADLTRYFPELQAAPPGLAGREAVLDGELLAHQAEGWPSFDLLRARVFGRPAAPAPAAFMAFDILHLDGRSTVALPLEERRALLDGLGLCAGRWRTSTQHLGDGTALLGASRDHALEGLVAKKLGTPYLPGQRSPTWLKLKNWCSGGFVLVGWLEDKDAGVRGWLRGLVVAWRTRDGLSFAGVVELGLRGELMDGVEQAVPMLTTVEPQASGAPPRTRWLLPRLEVQLQYLVGEGPELRTAVLRGLRLA